MDMNYAKIIIKPKSPFITSLQSDTIFGHFAWGYRYCFAENRLKELLYDFKEKPFIVFSDGFIKDTLPKPFLKPYLPKNEELLSAKEIKKVNFIDKELIFKNIDNLNDEVIFKELLNRKNKKTLKKETLITQKNSINRDSNLVTEGLYSIKENFFEENFEFEVYFKYQHISKEEIEKVFELISKRGYGKDKSTGKGKFEYTIEWDFDEKKYFLQKKGKYLNLSTMLKSNNMHLYYGKTITKFPKAGGIYAYSEPFKNPFIAFIAGSTFIVGEGEFGRAEERVFNKYNHFQNGFSIGIYFNGE
jgi:CRISPR-associated protein Csm4